MKITKKTKEEFQQNSEIIVTEMDGSLMMMSIEEGKYFELNPVSKRIWELLEEPSTVEFVCGRLLEEFEVLEEQCEAEVVSHFNELYSKKIISIP